MLQYRKIIIKALKAAPANADAEQRADLILAYIDFAKDLMGDDEPRSEIRRESFDIPIINVAPGPETMPSLIVTSDGPPPPSVPRRVTGKPSVDSQYHDLSELQSYIMKNAPPYLEVALRDGGQKVSLQRMVTQRQFPSTDGGIVQLAYVLPGVGDGPMVQFSTGEGSIPLPQRLDELRRAAEGQMSRKARTVEAKRPSPLAQDLDSILANSPSMDAGNDEFVSSRSGVMDTEKALEEMRRSK